MIKQALEYLVGLGNIRMENVGGQVFSTQPVYLVKEATAATIEVRSLAGLIDYLKSGFDGDKQEKLMVHVIDPTTVVAFSSFNRDGKRNELIQAKAMIPKFDFDHFHNPENFIIKLQSNFMDNEDRKIMLQVVGNIKEEAVNTIGDDGISQAVVAKTGVATVANVKVPNPVLLKPYRTFTEIDQPESEFIFRMQSGPKCALFEADGGSWKEKAMKNIKWHLDYKLKEEIEAGKVVIIG